MYKIDEGSCSIGRLKGRLMTKDGETQHMKISKIGGFAVSCLLFQEFIWTKLIIFL